MGLINKFLKSESENLEKEIEKSIAALLRTKQGFGAWQKGLGLSDYSYAACCEELVKKLLNEIRDNIVFFEKRIEFKHILLISEMSVNPLRFRMECALGGKPLYFYLSFKGSALFQIETQYEAYPL